MTDLPPPAAPTPGTCPVCGKVGTITAKATEITAKKRVKFGVFWVLLSLCSLGLGLILYLVWPRKTVIVSVDRYLQCSACGARI